MFASLGSPEEEVGDEEHGDQERGDLWQATLQVRRRTEKGIRSNCLRGERETVS